MTTRLSCTVGVLLGVSVLVSCDTRSRREALVVSHGGILDFGRVHAEDKAANIRGPYDIEIRNASPDAVVIRRMHSGCSCVIPSLQNSTIPSGGSTKFTAFLVPPLPPGAVAYKVYLHTNAPNQEIVPIVVTAYGLMGWRVNPPSLAVELYDDSSSDSRLIEVLGPTGEEDFAVLGVSTDSKFVTVRGWRKSGVKKWDSSQWLVDLCVTADEVTEDHATLTIDIRTSAGVEQTLVPVSIKRVGLAYAEPSSLTFVQDAGARPEWRRVTIKSRSGRRLIISQVSAENDLLNVRELRDDASPDVSVNVSVANSLAAGMRFSSVGVKMRNGEVVRIPVVIYVK